MIEWLADVPRSAGLTVIETQGWKERGHPIFKPIGVLCHHTANIQHGDMPSLHELIEGRSDLNGPLCNFGLSRSGKVYVIAAGRANHAGRGEYHPEVGWNEGNQLLLGIEAENSGYIYGPHKEPWGQVQMECYARLCAALLDKLGTSLCIGHKEYAPHRKTDPTFNMDVFRRTVATFRAHT